MSATGLTVCLAEWIIDDTCLVFFFNHSFLLWLHGSLNLFSKKYTENFKSFPCSCSDFKHFFVQTERDMKLAQSPRLTTSNDNAADEEEEEEEK